jgi:hypothetical protein
MKTIVNAGIALGVVCGAWELVMGYTGWYKHPALLNLFWLVILFEIAILIWVLRKTAAEGRRYGGQVGAGVLVSLIGGVIIVGFSVLFTTVLFPNYFNEMAAMNEQMLRAAGKSDADIAFAMDMYRKSANPAMNALSGFMGTVVTGLVASLGIAAFVRAK